MEFYENLMKTIRKLYRFIDLVWNSMIAKILSWLPCLFLWSFLIDFLFKSDQNPILAALPPPVVVSYWLLIQKLSKSSPGCLASSCGRFLLTSYSKVIKILSWLPCFKLINILSSLSWFLLKFDENHWKLYRFIDLGMFFMKILWNTLEICIDS